MAIIHVPVGGNLQAALNQAGPGDTVQLHRDATFSGTYLFTDKGTSDLPITVEPDSIGELPPEGSRITPDHAAIMPTIQPTTANAAALHFRPGAHHWRIRGLHAVTTTNLTNPGDIVEIGRNDADFTRLHHQPHHVDIDRCLIEGHPEMGGRRGISPHGRHIRLTGNYIRHIGRRGFDTSCIWTANGEGPIYVLNNHLEGASINILTGGGDPACRTAATVTNPTTTSCTLSTVQDLRVGQTIAFRVLGETQQRHPIVTSIDGLTITFTAIDVPPDSPGSGRWGTVVRDLIVRQNHILKPLDWMTWGSNEPTIKNLFELKSGINVLVEGNIFEQCWRTSAGGGQAFWLKSVNQSGNAPFIETTNVTIRHNIVRHVNGFLSISGNETGNTSQSITHQPKPLNGLTIENLLLYDSTTAWRSASATGSNDCIRQFNGARNVKYRYLTLIQEHGSFFMGEHNNRGNHAGLEFEGVIGFGGTWGIRVSNPSSTGTAALDSYTGGDYRYVKNVLAGVNSNQYPVGSFYPTTDALKAEFLDYGGGTTGDYQLLPTSPYKGLGVGGRDLGYDHGALMAAFGTIPPPDPVDPELPPPVVDPIPEQPPPDLEEPDTEPLPDPDPPPPEDPGSDEPPPIDRSAIRRVRQAPYIHSDRRWLFYNTLQLDCQVGIGTPEPGQPGEDPQVMLEWSDDRGQTWQGEQWRGAGALGDYKRRVIFRKLGRGKERIFRFVVDAPVDWALVDVFLDLTPGDR